MERRAKLVVLAIFLILICVVAIVAFFLQKSSSLPDFLVYDVEGELREQRYMTNFLLSFDIENNGTANASNIIGTVKFYKGEKWRSTVWLLNKQENLLEVGEKCSGCYAIITGYANVPSKNYLITVSCDEGVLREFNVTIP